MQPCGPAYRRAARWTAGVLLAVAGAMPAAAAEAGAGGLFQWQPFLAPFHSVALHLPIGFITLAFLLELYCWRRPSAEVRRVVLLVLGLSVASAAMASGLGWLRAASADYDVKTLSEHRWSGTLVVVLTAAAWLLLWKAKAEARGGFLLGLYRATLAAATGLLIYAGHQGGNLTHGSKYLVKNAPDFVRQIMDDEPEEVETGLAGADARTEFFMTKIQPIFEHKCQECHGAEKQKGGYRVDVRTNLFEGGKSGEIAIKAGDPWQSHLVKLITLPPDHDDLMPPAGKAVLSAQEVVDIIHWIGNGAAYPEKEAATTNKPAAVQLPTEVIPAAGPTNAAPATPAVAAAPPAPSKTITAAVLAAVPRSVDYEHYVKRIFDAHCIACHGPEKQKRGLRLDSREAALRGDRDGVPVIVPGRAAESLVYLRITLDPQTDVADEAMPPLHKKLPLSALEIATIGRWIDVGAR